MILTSHERKAGVEVGAVSAGFWIGAVTGACLIVASLLAEGDVADSLLAFGLAMPLFLLEDALRYVFIARHHPRRTAEMDSVWLVIELIGFGALFLCGAVSGPSITLVWGISAGLSCLLAKREKIMSLSGLVAFRYIIARRWAASRLLPDAVLNGMSSNALPVVLALVSGLGGTAALRAGQTLYGPIGIVVAGLSPVITVEAVRALRTGRSPIGLLWEWSGFVGAIGVLFGLLVFSIPDRIGARLFGGSWELAGAVLLPLAVQALLRGPLIAGALVLRARHLLNHALILRLATSVVTLVIPAFGAIYSGAEGAAWGLALAAAINGVLAILMVYQTKRIVGRDIEDA